MNKTDNRQNTRFITRYSKTVLMLLSQLPLVILAGCFTSNSAPTTPASAEISNRNDNVDSKPDTPTLTVKYTVKQLRFSWKAVAGATYYRILENPDGISGFSPISAALSTTSYAHEIKRRTSGWMDAQYQLEACNSSLKCSISNTVGVEESILAGIPPVTASNGGLNDYFGVAVALSRDGKTLVVGAPGEDSSTARINGDENNNKQPQSGAVYVFEYRDDKWTQQAYLKASNSSQNSKFGYSVALSIDGSTLAIGAPEGEGKKAEKTGTVYIFSRSNNQWREQALLRATNAETGDLFGTSVSLDADGTTLAIGAPGKDSSKASSGSNNNTIDSGAIYIWTFNSDGQWQQQQYIEPDAIIRLGGFGKVVTLSSNGNTLAISANKGASTDNAGEGAIYVLAYQSEKGQWSHQQLIKAPTPIKESLFGASMALSADGNTLAAGARQEKNNTDDHAGAVYLFTRNSTGQWAPQGTLHASNAGSHDEFGSSLAFNGDASLLAVGAPFEDSMATGVNGNQTRDECCNSGSIYLFEFTAQQWKQIAYIKPTVSSVDDNERLFGEFGTSIALSSDSSILAVGAPHLASLLLLTGEIRDTLAAPTGDGVVYLYSPLGMF